MPLLPCTLASFGSEPIQPSARATIIADKQIRAILDRPDTAAMYDSVARVVDIGGEYHVAIAAVRRSRVGDATPPDALSHHDITEIYHVVDGKGEFVSGGTIVGGSEMPADSRGVKRVVGPSMRGTAIRGGESRSVGAGDIIVIPPNTAHGFSRIDSRRIVYTVVRVDPRRRLPATSP